jgi:hypothetical protein
MCSSGVVCDVFVVCGQTRSNKLLFQLHLCGAASQYGLGSHLTTTLAVNLQCRTSLVAAAHLACLCCRRLMWPLQQSFCNCSFV